MTFCGIDFGTSNSAIATKINGEVDLLPVEDGSNTLPSAIFYATTQSPVFGRRAQKLFFEGEEGRFMRSLKRILGTSRTYVAYLVNQTAEGQNAQPAPPRRRHDPRQTDLFT